MPQPELAGRTLAGRYDVLELLGAGGMGSVYRAHDRELDEIVALKVIRSDRASATAIDQFRHEVKLARRVTHVNIARTFELGWADGVMYCTMELVEGESLRRRLMRERILSPPEATAIARALCDGLAAAHAAGVIHRDIKPDNILLAADGRVVLADFGVAALGAEADGTMSGTLEYMAPEQARGEPPTPATDVYSVGLVLYEMLTGLRAFAGTVTELIVAKQDIERVTFEYAEVLSPARVPGELADVVARATTRDPADRIADAGELASLLAPWLVAEPVTVAARVTKAEQLATVIVLAPHGDSERLHIAEGIHQALLRRLVETPRVRVLPRVVAPASTTATIVALHAHTALDVEVRTGDTAAALRVPLVMASIDLAADAIASAVVAAVSRNPDPTIDAYEMLLRARTFAHRGFNGVLPAYKLLKAAHAQVPDDPRIAADLAALLMRFSFAGEFAEDIAGAKKLVEMALARAPGLAETHVAAAHYELQAGNSAAAAAHFRTAIACSPFLAEGHEGLGRMLLEAGFLDDAVSRLEDALAIAPQLSAVRWEIARAHALEQNWIVYDQVAAELLAIGDRPLTRLRFELWRGGFDAIAEIERHGNPGWEHELMAMFYDIVLRHGWPQHREAVLRVVTQRKTDSRRGLAVIAQIAADAAGFANDAPACLRLLHVAVDAGLYDLHWWDRDPLLGPVRLYPEFAEMRAVVKTRADAILDALFCDRMLADTTVR